MIFKAFNEFRLGDRIKMEILAVEFVRNLDKFSLRDKTRILHSLAKADVDASNIL